MHKQKQTTQLTNISDTLMFLMLLTFFLVTAVNLATELGQNLGINYQHSLEQIN